MRALVLEQFGGQPRVADVPSPQPGAGEVLVRVRSASVNGFDLAVAAGTLKGLMEYRFPVVIGKDFAGTVEEVGEGVVAYAPGDEVFGVVMRPDLHDGSIGELVAVPVAFGIAKRSDDLRVGEAGALGLAGAGALAAVEAVQVGRDDSVLVCGATGGAGSFAVQLLVGRGARVIATARAGEAADFVRSLGAHDVVDYTGDLAAQVRELAPDGVEAALHLAGDPAALLELVRDDGRLASSLGFGPEQAGDQRAIAIAASPDAATLGTLASAVADGTLRVNVQRWYPLNDAAAALDDFSQGTRGKLAITID